jgi:hypothetical protein
VELQWCRLREMEEGKRGRRRGGSTVSEADDIVKRGAAAGEAEGDGWRSKMTKENWVGGLNVWLSRTTDRVSEKIWLRV